MITPKLKHKFKAKIGDKFSAGIGLEIPKAGCPLEDLPLWKLIYSGDGGSSRFCWDNFGKIIIANRHDTAENNGHFIAYKNIYGEAATLQAEVIAAPAGTENFVIPFCKWIDADNLVGARYNNSEVQIVQRHNGTWSTLATATGLSTGLWKVIITSKTITVFDDWSDAATKVVEVEHVISANGFFGIHGHKWPHDNTALMTDYRIYPMNPAQLPCMTGYTTPFGVVTASSEWSSTYAAWKAFSCTRTGPTDAWVPVSGDQPAWVQWFFDGVQPMIPTKIEVAPRRGMSTSWYNANNPQGITVFGVNRDGSIEQIWTRQTIGDWPSDLIRSWYITGITKGYYGIRIQIDKTNQSESGGIFSTGVGWFQVYGVAPTTPPDHQLVVSVLNSQYPRTLTVGIDEARFRNLNVTVEDKTLAVRIRDVNYHKLTINIKEEG